ncbi:hypothetical protein D3C75_1095610 [compost metagenome]
MRVDLRLQCLKRRFLFLQLGIAEQLDKAAKPSGHLVEHVLQLADLVTAAAF